MPLCGFQRQYEQLSQFEREIIIGMMEAGWSSKPVVRQLGHSYCVVRRCWVQWIREMSFTQRPGSRRLDRPVVETTTSLSPPVTNLHWPVLSPYLSPIEHIWDHLGWRVGHATSLNELKARLQQIWNEMSQGIIQNLYASVPDRIASCI
ncbi:transposable element Tcb2 transposase [Trichonephila clavipes]|nr:transposable element Tcb2 transposase [Trichonephila clavipes]